MSSFQELEVLVQEHPDFGHQQVKFYNQNGFVIFEDDFEFLSTNSLIYICNESLSIAQYMKEFNIVRQLGHGAFGHVFQGNLLHNIINQENIELITLIGQ